MIKFENTEVVGWEAAIRGMRNPMNSWEKSDSLFIFDRYLDDLDEIKLADICGNKAPIIGLNDLDLIKRLRNAGTDHRKFMRMIVVYVDITAPLYWWKEFDTYKVGTVANSCSTMHKIHAKEFTLEDFSCEHLMTYDERLRCECEIDHEASPDGFPVFKTPKTVLEITIRMLNEARKKYLETKDKKYWWQMIQLLPSAYNQKRTVMLNYEVLANIYKSRRNHKLDEWCEHKTKLPSELVKTCNDALVDVGKGGNGMFGFCDWIKTLPYCELITGEFETKKANDDISVLTPNEYQKQAARTVNKTLTPNGQLEEGLMGLNGEAGECLEILKKHLFQNQSLDKEHLAEELGDVAWYLAESAYAIDYDLEMILKMNLRKLEERYPKKRMKNEEED